MPGNFKQIDLRIIKTHRAIIDSFTTLLTKRNFGRITVNDICEEAQLSRTAFYSHYNDKYDLLSSWLTKQMPLLTYKRNSFNEMEIIINRVVSRNKSVIIHLFEDANDETIDIIKEYVMNLFSSYIGIEDINETSQFNIVLLTFCTGGLINMLKWQIKNNFPSNFKIMNNHLYEIIEELRKFENIKSKNGEYSEKKL